MKRIVVGIAVVVAILSTSVAWAHAAPGEETVGAVGRYQGNFSGIAYGDKGSRAPLALALTHRGSQVEGNVSIGEGLHVDAGLCGSFDLPTIDASIEGETLDGDSRRLEASPTFDAGAFELTVQFESEVSASGRVIVTRAKVDLPWFCGQDPVLTGILLRE
jgi:hypothetical protein